MKDPIVMVQVFAEQRYGVVAHTRENSVKYGLNFNQTPYYYEYNLLEWVVGVVESTFAKNAHLSFCVLRRLDLLVSEDEVREVRVP